MMFTLVLAAAAQLQSTPIIVRVRVVQSCTVSSARARCSGTRDRAPTPVRENGRIVYSF